MQPHYIEEIANFSPSSPEEAAAQNAILWYAGVFGDQILLRDNLMAHITSSGFIMNPALDKVLMIHHNIRDAWAWTGGHADGDADLLSVALREAREETGVQAIAPLSADLASVDILPVYPHTKNGRCLNAHMHLSVAYILVCGEDEHVRVKPDENSGVRWFGVDEISSPLFDGKDVALYTKLMQWAWRRMA